jgi:hypothetical protein
MDESLHLLLLADAGTMTPAAGEGRRGRLGVHVRMFARDSQAPAPSASGLRYHVHGAYLVESGLA